VTMTPVSYSFPVSPKAYMQTIIVMYKKKYTYYIYFIDYISNLGSNVFDNILLEVIIAPFKMTIKNTCLSIVIRFY